MLTNTQKKTTKTWESGSRAAIEPRYVTCVLFLLVFFCFALLSKGDEDLS